GPGGGPHVRVFKLSGQNLVPVAGFFAYSQQFPGGVQVGAGDVDGQKGDELITGAGPGGGPHVQWFKVNVANGAVTTAGGLFAYDKAFPGGVFVAGRAAGGLLTGAGAGGGPQVSAFNSAGHPTPPSFFAYSPQFPGGVRVASGDLAGDATDKIVTGAGAGGGPQVSAFDADGTPTSISFYAYAAGFHGGVFVALAAG